MNSFDVLLFAVARDLAGSDRIRIDLPEGATVADLIAALPPVLASLAERSRIAVDHEFAEPERILLTDQEIALIPPVSGG